MLANAVAEVRNGALSFGEPAEKYEIPKTTIYDTFKGKVISNKLGQPKKLSHEIDQILVTLLIRLSDIGLGLSKY